MKFATSILLSLATISVAGACNIPVFRYALERWRPDECEVIVFHEGDLTAEQETLLAKWKPDAGGKHPRANARIIRSDLSQATAVHRDLWEAIDAEPDATLPPVLVRTKLGAGRIVNGWNGPLDAIEHTGLFDSPAREILSRRLLSGHSIVWLMIGSEDPQRNQTMRQMLTSQFESLAERIELPDGIGLPGSELHSEIPLRMRFSLLEIDRSDPQEAFLVRWLSSFQPAAYAAGQPLIIAVFGRGRALEVIPASVMSEQLMEDLTLFLSGACSCQVKEQNPGFDLLLSVDWNRELYGQAAEPPAAKPTAAPREPVLLSIPPGR